MISAKLTIQEPVFVANNGDFVIITAEDYKEFMRLKNNEEYLKKLEKSQCQIENGEVVVKSLEELEAMECGF